VSPAAPWQTARQGGPGGLPWEGGCAPQALHPLASGIQARHSGAATLPLSTPRAVRAAPSLGSQLVRAEVSEVLRAADACASQLQAGPGAPPAPRVFVGGTALLRHRDVPALLGVRGAGGI
jgi:hypothetical protein